MAGGAFGAAYIFKLLSRPLGHGTVKELFIPEKHFVNEAHSPTIPIPAVDDLAILVLSSP